MNPIRYIRCRIVPPCCECDWCVKPNALTYLRCTNPKALYLFAQMFPDTFEENECPSVKFCRGRFGYCHFKPRKESHEVEQ